MPLDQFGKCSHPLKTDNDDLYNIFSGQVALTTVNGPVNVAISLSFGEPMVAACRNTLPSGLYSKLTSPVNTMEHLKKGVKIGDKVVFDLESIFFRLLIVGQQRDMELMPIFGCGLYAVPPSLVDKYGCLHKGNKAPLVERL